MSKSILLPVLLIACALSARSAYAFASLENMSDREMFFTLVCGTRTNTCISEDPADAPEAMKAIGRKVLARAALLPDLFPTEALLRDVDESAAESAIREIKLRRPMYLKALATGDKRRQEEIEEDVLAFVPMPKKKTSADVGMTTKELPYYRFIPQFMGHLRAVGSDVAFSSPCFDSITATLQPMMNNSNVGKLISVAISPQGRKTATCSSRVWLQTAWGHTTVTLEDAQNTTGFINATEFDSDDMWDYTANGVRVYLQNTTKFELWASVIETMILFIPNFIVTPPGPIVTANNMQFFNNYSMITPPFSYRKGHPGVLGINESEIKSGDIMFMTEMEGLALTIGLGTGTTAGHTTIFLRNETNDLHVCESTDPNVVCTPFKPWAEGVIKQRGASLVWLPLKPEYSAKFNVTAAWQYVRSALGYSYGFSTFIFGWIDTPEDNYPCMPPDFQRCLRWQHMDYVFRFMDRILPTFAHRYFGQAFQNRMNMSTATYNSIASLFRTAATQHNIEPVQLMTMKEKDSYRYHTTRYGKKAVGPSMVCSTFACNTHKAGGIFDSIGGDLECGEQTPFNVGAMKLYDETRMYTGRPQVCQAADPNNRLCQLAGTIEFHLEVDVNTLPIRRQMGNNCPSKNVNHYNHSLDC